MMNQQKDQHKVGTPEKPRGQEMGRPGFEDQSRQEKDDTPALRGLRKEANKMFADESSQHIGADAATPTSNSPSLPAALPGDVKLGESGGERSFKERHAGQKPGK
jgi:hypothetical protein